MSEIDWQQYLSRFHGERAGITEDVLEHALDADGRTAYDWAADPVGDGVVLDLACGSGPLAARLVGRGYLGLDLSPAELAVAAGRGLPVARADVTQIPLPDDSVQNVVMSMALMLVPLQRTLAEVCRVLRPSGTFVATLPTNRPMPRGDWLRYARLCLALRHPGLTYPNDRALADAHGPLARANLTLLDDQARAFVCDVADGDIADDLFGSMYLPTVPARRLAAGRQVVQRWVGSTVATPIRRLVATKATPP